MNFKLEDKSVCNNRVDTYFYTSYTCITTGKPRPDIDKMITKVKLKAWGNSLGAIIPKEIVNQIGLKEGEEVEISVRPVTRDIKRLFGKYHTGSAQEAKDEMRAGWRDGDYDEDDEEDDDGRRRK